MLRDINKFLDFDKLPLVYTSFEDSICGFGEEKPVDQGQNLEVYLKRVADYLVKPPDLTVIQKLNRNLPIISLHLVS